MSVFTNAKSWIALLFVLRLYHLNIPALDQHSWRQAITLGVARNYLEEDANFFHPRAVLRDSRTGILAQEFPIFNYLIFIGWKIVGTENWVFRLINLITCSLGLWWFYLFVEKLMNKRTALFAMLIFGASIAYIYARKAMPDVFSISLALGAVHYGWSYLEKQKWKDGCWFFVLGSLGMLSKIPAAAILTLLAFPFLLREYKLRAKVNLTVLSFISLGIVLLWYYGWVPWAEQTYHHRLFYPQTIAKGWDQIIYQYSYRSMERFHTIAFQNQFAFYLSVLGFINLFFVKKRRLFLITWLLYSAVFFYFMIRAGYVFSSHEYYILPYIPLMAICAGFFIDYWLPKKRWLTPVVLLVMGGLGIIPQWRDMSVRPENKKYLSLEAICEQYIPKDARILTTLKDGNPMMLYFCHRLGWNAATRWRDPKWLAGEATVGMDYVVIHKEKVKEPLGIPLIYEGDHFLIYKTVPRNKK